MLFSYRNSVYLLEGKPVKTGREKMSERERLACWMGAILIGFAAMLILRNEPSTTRRRRRNRDEPVEVLAEELKEAWAEFHTP
jgi:hypothetical protein